MGETATLNQNGGSFSVLQPFNCFFDPDWKPAALCPKNVRNQFGLLIGATYLDSQSSSAVAHMPLIHGSSHPFLGNALFDYQLAWFPPATAGKESFWWDNPNLLLECSSGPEFSTFRFGAAHRTFTSTSLETELIYQNICSLTYSFWNRLGVTAAAEWDAPLDSHPLPGSKAYYANTATISAGLVYNLYPTRFEQGQAFFDWRRLSVSVLYSYTAFDPSIESNQLQFQISYSF